jgi:hypothetical protein
LLLLLKLLGQLVVVRLQWLLGSKPHDLGLPCEDLGDHASCSILGVKFLGFCSGRLPHYICHHWWRHQDLDAGRYVVKLE